jgi:SAM-dependent methyltransferase
MSFPHHDAHWNEAAAFVEQRRRPGERVLAPDLFWWRLRRIERYRSSFGGSWPYDWAVIHKGLLDELDRAFLKHLDRGFEPVFANAVFVVWARSGRLARCEDGVHLEAFFRRRQELERRPAPPGPAPETLVLPDPDRIDAFDTLGSAGIARAMDAFWRHGGYRYDTRRDQVYLAELTRLAALFIGDAAGRDVIDIACGDGRNVPLLAGAASYVGIDVSREALALAAARAPLPARHRLEARPAEDLGEPDDSFDLTLFIEAAEHVLDVKAALDEVVRVTRPGGRLVVNAANRDSLHQVMTRKLGHPPFLTNYQHIREFGYDEFARLLEERGFAILRATGIFLHPYWGVPAVDPIVRDLVDHDEDVVEILRELGEKAGPRHAYCFMIEARRRPEG